MPDEKMQMQIGRASVQQLDRRHQQLRFGQRQQPFEEVQLPQCRLAPAKARQPVMRQVPAGIGKHCSSGALAYSA